MSGWQPIETAPKDGTRVLVYDGRFQSCGQFKQFEDGTAIWFSSVSDYGSFILIGGKLTHWAPLLDPPK